MATVVYCTIVCDVPDCGEESTFEPTVAQARQTALYEGWHFRRLGGERWFCPDHEKEWRAEEPKR
jgi:hypothetical protein